MDATAIPSVSSQVALPYRPHQSADDWTRAINELEDQRRLRSVQELKLQLAQHYIDAQKWRDALDVLRPLWVHMTYRHEGWWDIVEDVCCKLRLCAETVGDVATIVAVDWELMSRTFTPKQEWKYDLSRAIEGKKEPSTRPLVVLRDSNVHSFLTATFAFETAEGKVGESARAQLTFASHAVESAASLTIVEAKITFEGNMRPIVLRNQPAVDDGSTSSSPFDYSIISLHDAPVTSELQARSRDHRPPALEGEAALSFEPGKTKVFEFACPLREAGDVRAISVTVTVAAESFDLEYTATFDRNIVNDVWWWQKAAKKRLVRGDPHAMNILPRPPKMDVHFAELQEQYYTNEAIMVQLDIANGEEEDSVAELTVQVVGDQKPTFTLKSGDKTMESDESSLTSRKAGLLSVELGRIASSGKTSATVEIPPLILPAIFDMTIQLSYHLCSDPETPISKTTTVRLTVVSPFEANYDFSPRLDPTPWPNFFIYDDDGESAELDKSQLKAKGLCQAWCLTARYASFATEPLIIEAINIATISLEGGITCTTTKLDHPTQPLPHSIQPRIFGDAQFALQTRKLSLDDRRSASLDLHLVMHWRRSAPNSPLNTTHLPIPRLLVASSEPRVLASVTYSRVAGTNISLLALSYTIENPSMHFLTFGVLMHPSDSFAFSGVKQTSVQLLPLSRRTIRINALPSVRGEWIRPVLVVRDRYFQKVLRVVPASEGLRADKEGVLVWVPPEEEENEVVQVAA